MTTCQRVRLSEVIHQNAMPEKITDTRNERYVTVSLYGNGVRERVIKDDKYPVPFVGYRVSEGQFIYSRIDARNGAYGIIGPDLDGFVVSKDFPVYDIDTSRVLPQFLLISVLSESFLHQVKNSSFGATNRMRIKEEILEDYSIYLPPLEEQARLANLISAAQAVLDLRQRQLRALDTLIKARFVEMTENSETIPTRMGDVATYINGYAFKPSDWETKGWPIIRIQNLNDEKAAYNYFSGIIDEKYHVQSGDVLISWATHLEAYIWNGGDAWINQHIFRVDFDKVPINKTYFVYSTDEALRQAFKNAHGFKPTMEHIKRSDFENAIIKLPSLEVQEQFALFVKQVDKSKVAVQAALEKAQLLFDSLMQQYFG